MSFKVHLLIISCIVIVVLLAWQFMQNLPAAAPAVSDKPVYSIAINHASWGLNCKEVAINTDQDVFLEKNKTEPASKLHEDNVLGPVGRLCNGNTKCDITPDEASLGTDPAPDCPHKVLEIEYRCFSYDRPWNAKTTQTPISIDCEKSNNK